MSLSNQWLSITVLLTCDYFINLKKKPKIKLIFHDTVLQVQEFLAISPHFPLLQFPPYCYSNIVLQSQLTSLTFYDLSVLQHCRHRQRQEIQLHTVKVQLTVSSGVLLFGRRGTYCHLSLLAGILASMIQFIYETICIYLVTSVFIILYFT